MATKQLVLAVLAVALVGGGAHVYLNKMDGQKSSATVTPPASTSNTEQAATEETTEEVSDEETVPTQSTTNGGASTASENETAGSASAPASTGASVEETLDELDALFEEDYDDSSIDGSFSGNLDEVI